MSVQNETAGELRADPQDSPYTAAALVTWFQGLPAETQRAIVAAYRKVAEEAS